MDTALTALKGEINRLGFVSELPSMDTALTALKGEINRLGLASDEKIQVDAQACLDSLTEDDEKCGYLRFLISAPEPQGIPTNETIKNILRESISKFDNTSDGVPNISCITTKVDVCTTAKMHYRKEESTAKQRLSFLLKNKQLAKHLSALSVNSTSKKEVWIYYHKGDYLKVLQARKVKGKNNGIKSAVKKIKEETLKKQLANSGSKKEMCEEIIIYRYVDR
ncbi:13608_t:CDS:2 [Ambispora gerdemannii]|uniref:13608_t:CDS:1 n=1 Tax=Ambispora gerdemannii TaxID=144530 RepID=A0A9N8WNE9_9GLOM|nr:13608_t:CDS:2 [Ambispora gerdemannii]